jgi:Mn-dependent DtxR family transcriptional regulator
MCKVARKRDPESEEKERASFILLQHIYSLTGGGDEQFSLRKVASDLAFEEDQVAKLATHLIQAGILDGGPGPDAKLRDFGRKYIERLAGRRRSVRV